MVRCSVMRCKSDSGRKIPGLSFHSFPEQDHLRRNWILATGRTDWKPKLSSKICSRHFEDRMIIKKNKQCLLLPSAVPLVGTHACIPSSSSMSLQEETLMEIGNNFSIHGRVVATGLGAAEIAKARWRASPAAPTRQLKRVVVQVPCQRDPLALDIKSDTDSADEGEEPRGLHAAVQIVSRPDIALLQRPDTALLQRPDTALLQGPDTALLQRPDTALLQRPDTALLQRPDTALLQRDNMIQRQAQWIKRLQLRCEGLRRQVQALRLTVRRRDLAIQRMRARRLALPATLAAPPAAPERTAPPAAPERPAPPAAPERPAPPDTPGAPTVQVMMSQNLAKKLAGRATAVPHWAPGTERRAVVRDGLVIQIDGLLPALRPPTVLRLHTAP